MKDILFYWLILIFLAPAIFGQTYNVPVSSPSAELTVLSGKWLWPETVRKPLRLLPASEDNLNFGIILYRPLDKIGANYISAEVSMPSKTQQKSQGHIGLLVRASSGSFLTGYVAYLGFFSNTETDTPGTYLALERRLLNETIDFPVAVKMPNDFDLSQPHKLSIRAEGESPVRLTLTVDQQALIDYLDQDPQGEPVNGSLVGFGAVWEGYNIHTEFNSVNVGSEAQPFYELKGRGKYFYTLFPDEVVSAIEKYNYIQTDIVGNINSRPTAGNMALYRAFRSDLGRHVFFTDIEELATLAKEGYQYEGVAGYIWPNEKIGLVPLKRFFSPENGYWLYTEQSQKMSRRKVETWQPSITLGYVIP